MPREPSCSCGECRYCARRIKRQAYERKRYEKGKADPEFMTRKRASNRVTMERWRRERGMQPAKPPLSPEEREARRLARQAARPSVSKGVRPGSTKQGGHFWIPTCQVCGEAAPTEKHHPDYSKPKLILWVCKPCHVQITYRA